MDLTNTIIWHSAFDFSPLQNKLRERISLYVFIGMFYVLSHSETGNLGILVRVLSP